MTPPPPPPPRMEDKPTMRSLDAMMRAMMQTMAKDGDLRDLSNSLRGNTETVQRSVDKLKNTAATRDDKVMEVETRLDEIDRRPVEAQHSRRVHEHEDGGCRRGCSSSKRCRLKHRRGMKTPPKDPQPR